PRTVVLRELGGVENCFRGTFPRQRSLQSGNMFVDVCIVCSKRCVDIVDYLGYCCFAHGLCSLNCATVRLPQFGGLTYRKISDAPKYPWVPTDLASRIRAFSLPGQNL